MNEIIDNKNDEQQTELLSDVTVSTANEADAYEQSAATETTLSDDTVADTAVNTVADSPALPELTRDELRLISLLDGKVTGMAELMTKPTYGEFERYRKLGIGAVDAFRLANFDGIVETVSAAARQAVLNTLDGRVHHVPTVAHGSGAASVPADILSEYKALLPNAGEKEIICHYNRYLRKER